VRGEWRFAVTDDPALRVRDCLLRYAAEQDDRVILDPAVLAAAREVYEQVKQGAREPFDDPRLRASPLWILGQFHLLRYAVLPEEECLAALQEAAECFLPLYAHDPGLVPALVVPILRQRAGQETAGVLDEAADEAISRLQACTARGDSVGIRAALGELRAVLGATPDPGPRRTRLLCEMAAALGARYEAGGDEADLDAALKLITEAAESAPGRYRYRTAAIRCSLLAERYRLRGDDADIVHAFAAARRALRELTYGDAERGELLWALSTAREMRFARSGGPHHLNAAIACLREAGGILPAAQRPQLAARLGGLLIDRFAADGGPWEISGGLSGVADSVSFIDPASPQRADVLWHLAVECQRRYDESGRLDYLDATIDCIGRTLDPALDGHPGRAAFHSAMGVALTSRFDRSADIEDLNSSVKHGYQATGMPVHDASVRPSMLQGLASALRKRAELRNSETDLDEAIAIGRRALDEAVRLGVSDALILAELAAATATRYLFDGDTNNLAMSCELGYAALGKMPRDHPSWPTLLGNLGHCLRDRFRATGDQRFLDEAIALTRQTAEASGAGSVGRVLQLHNLALALRNRYELRLTVGDLDEAIACWREADQDGPAGNLHHGDVLMGLAGGLLRRHERPKNKPGPPGTADLNAAIDCTRRALGSSSLPAASRAVALSHLAGMLHIRFGLNGDPADLDAAVATSRQALAEVPPGFPAKSDLVLNHIQILPKDDAQDIDQALDLGRSVGQELPGDDPRQARYLTTIAGLHYQRFQHTRQAGDLDAAIAAWRTAARIVTAPAHIRAAAARSWGRVLAAQGGPGVWPEALEALTLAVELQPLIVWRGMDRISQEEALATRPMIASDAAACAIAAGRPETAVELLEQGRTLLWGQWLGTRDALSELRGTAPDLAERLSACRAQLDRAADGTGLMTAELLGLRAIPPNRPQQAAGQLEQAARIWEETLAEVRALPGYESFLLPRSFSQLQAAASQGPVCIINVSAIRCDVLAVCQDGVRVIALPDLTIGDVGRHAGGHIDALHRVPSNDPRLQDAVNAMLEWLWEAVAGPVLDALERDGIPVTRIWWCPTGPLSLLPVHAAGHHRDRAQRSTVIGRVVSSYAPSLSMLIHARRPVKPSGQASRMLAVGMPDPPAYTAGIAALPSAAREIDTITSLLGSGCQVRVGDQATREEILRQLPLHSWAHFACHGGQDIDRPALGALHLYDAPLRVTEIGALDTDNAEFAYLSACETAMGGLFLFDEAINVATAFHYAGYRHVIATFWAIRDDTAAQIAERVYARLTASGTLDCAEAATALHAAVRTLAEQYPDSPHAWAAYVHLGP
jgi:tetratricopeptide (TPR) repeat protein